MTDQVVVVADDEPDIREVVGEALRDELGVRPELACDGIEALARVWALRPRVLLLDWMMPRLDGPGVCRALRAEPPAWPMATLVMSAAPVGALAVGGGCAAFIEKPFRLDELLDAVQRCLTGPFRP